TRCRRPKPRPRSRCARSKTQTARHVSEPWSEHVITLGSRQFAGPFISRLWLPPKAPGLYAVMVPGWRLLMFHAVHFGHADDLSLGALVKEHPKYGYWMTLAGSEWNIY